MLSRRRSLVLLSGAALWFAAGARAAPDVLDPTQANVRDLLLETLANPDYAVRGRLIAQAEAQARAMLASAPHDISARLMLALAIGMKARRAKPMEAMRAGWAQEGQKLVADAVKEAPDNAWAQALYGGWHLEVLRRGGPAGAAFFGARESAGIAAFERARSLAPQDGAIALHYAVALLGLAPQRFAGKAIGLLDFAVAAPAESADFSAPVRATAIAIRQTLAAKGPAAAKALVDTLA